MLAADGASLPDKRFVALPPIPGTLLAEGFRRAVLKFLVKNGALSEALRSRMLAWRHCGFSAHNAVRVAAEDAEGRKKLAGYMLRAPMSEATNIVSPRPETAADGKYIFNRMGRRRVPPVISPELKDALIAQGLELARPQKISRVS